jgi:uncharacterized protein
MIHDLQPAWMSEHLAFNRARAPAGIFSTGFLLPPRQTPAGVAAAISSVRAVSDCLPVPFAVENSVSYLRSRADELTDGAFLGAVAGGADCGIVLDLHNAWTNHLNGRQDLHAFLDKLPLERVWEVHLGGGVSHCGYWLDAHSGPIPSSLLAEARHIVPLLPNLKALIFEIAASYVEKVGRSSIRRQLEYLQALWALRVPMKSGQPTTAVTPIVPTELGGPRPETWEVALGSLVTDRACEGAVCRELAADPGVAIFRQLVAEFRSSTVVGTLPFTGRLLLHSLPTKSLDALLAGFWRVTPADGFGARETRQFAAYLRENAPTIRLLPDILAFDLAVVEALIERTATTVLFDEDPRPILSALAERRLPRPAREVWS